MRIIAALPLGREVRPSTAQLRASGEASRVADDQRTAGGMTVRVFTAIVTVCSVLSMMILATSAGSARGAGMALDAGQVPKCRDRCARDETRAAVAWHDEDPSRQQMDPRLDQAMDQLIDTYRP